ASLNMSTSRLIDTGGALSSHSTNAYGDRERRKEEEADCVSLASASRRSMCCLTEPPRLTCELPLALTYSSYTTAPTHSQLVSDGRHETADGVRARQSTLYVLQNDIALVLLRGGEAVSQIFDRQPEI